MGNRSDDRAVTVGDVKRWLWWALAAAAVVGLALFLKYGYGGPCDGLKGQEEIECVNGQPDAPEPRGH